MFDVIDLILNFLNGIDCSSGKLKRGHLWQSYYNYDNRSNIHQQQQHLGNFFGHDSILPEYNHCSFVRTINVKIKSVKQGKTFSLIVLVMTICVVSLFTYPKRAEAIGDCGFTYNPNSLAGEFTRIASSTDTGLTSIQVTTSQADQAFSLDLVPSSSTDASSDVATSPQFTRILGRQVGFINGTPSTTDISSMNYNNDNIIKALQGKQNTFASYLDANPSIYLRDTV